MNDDLISRQAAIDAADMADYPGLSIEDVDKVTGEVVKALKELPSAQPLSEQDLTEIADRFGGFVRFVVEDMLTGRGQRWEKTI